MMKKLVLKRFMMDLPHQVNQKEKYIGIMAYPLWIDILRYIQILRVKCTNYFSNGLYFEPIQFL